MFASLVVTLPSQFTGGSLQLQHAGEVKQIKMNPDSAFSTQLIAWYTDVVHAVEPIQSGYRLALSYNLIHAIAPSLRPALSTTSPHAKELRRVLTNWKKKQTPQLIVYLFDHQYSSSNLLSAALKGKDAHVIRNLRAVAEPLGFRIYVANIQLHQIGMDMGDEGYDDDWDQEFGHSTWNANCLIDLQGNPVDIKKVQISGENVIPYKLSEQEPDHTVKEGYTGDVSIKSSTLGVSYDL
jgi:hypothetical protein